MPSAHGMASQGHESDMCAVVAASGVVAQLTRSQNIAPNLQRVWI